MRVDSFAALRYRDFRLLWFGQLVSMSGTQMQRVAIAWHIYLLTHDPIALGLIGVFRVLPVLIFSLIGGVIADAQDRRRVLLFTQTGMMLAAAALAWLTWARFDSAPVVYLLVALTAVAGSFDGPARQSLVSNVVPREHVANAFSLNSIMGEVARVVGASVAGLVIAGLGGVGMVYTLNAVSYLAISAWGLPAMLFVLAATGLLRGLQDTRTPLVIVAVGFGVNAVLNALFIRPCSTDSAICGSRRSLWARC